MMWRRRRSRITSSFWIMMTSKCLRTLPKKVRILGGVHTGPLPVRTPGVMRVQANRDLAAALRDAACAVLDFDTPFWRDDESVGDTLFVRVRWDLRDVLVDSNVAWADCVHYLRWYAKVHYSDFNHSRSFISDNGLAKETVEDLYACARDSSCTDTQKRVHAIGVLLKIFPDYLEGRGNHENPVSDPLAYWRTLRLSLIHI